MRPDTVLVLEAPANVQATFVRGTAARLAAAALIFAVLLAGLACLLPVDLVVGWMRQWPLAVVLPAASLSAAWAARWWAETERRRPLLVLALHVMMQAFVLAPLAVVLFDWLGVWVLLAVGVMLTGVLAAIPRVARFHLPRQQDAAALALSAAAADPVWYVWKLVRSVATSRD